MIGPSKILTVSYGTFSCTLEGFDDPFSTMRGIAEYFRDLAADDRYFGAEPPTPDAEMLHRIAEREVQNRVEAKVNDDGIVLRQLEETQDDAEEVVQTPITAPEVAEAPVAETTAATVAEHVEVTEVEQPSPAQPESVAAKLARIRAVVSLGDTDILDADNQPDAPNFSEASLASAFDAEPEFKAEVEEVVEAATDVEEIEAIDETDVTDGQTDVDAIAAVMAIDSEADESDEAPEITDSVDLSARFADEEEPEADVQNVEAEEPSEETLAEAFADVLSSEVSPEDDANSEEVEAEDTEASISRFMDTMSDDDNAEDEPSDVEMVATEEASEEPDSSAIARVVKMRRADYDAALETDDVDEADTDAEDDSIEAESAIDVASEAEASVEADTEIESDHDVVAEETASEDDLDTQFFADPDEHIVDDQSTLSAEDEADLMATLDEVTRQADADSRAEKEGRVMLEKNDIEDSAESVSRILEVTNTEMEETEGTRRRSAIAHLKAAVAATRADKILGLGRAKDEAEEINQYRDDLAQAVRPRRPSADGDKPKARRMAPLVLVSEQRVDEDPEIHDALDNDVVIPRRIMNGNLALDDDNDLEEMADGENIFRDAHSFAEFAEEMGAHELPDLLEAAAAYSSYVEGREHFSRPQIMKAVAELNSDGDFSREESLRSFGLLLRRGRIKKIKRGQFIIADTTRFNPEVRAVGE